MALVAEQEFRHIGETCGCKDHDHDLVHELSRRLDGLWRYDQYIANADWRDGPRQFWEEIKVAGRAQHPAIERLDQRRSPQRLLLTVKLPLVRFHPP